MGALPDCTMAATCDPLEDGDPLAECTAACASSDACEELGPDGCAAVCSGALVALGLAGEPHADCVAAQLQAGGCHPSLAKVCKP
jgi:hypothetical protein